MVDLECSDTCQDITAEDTHLSSPSGNATFVCKNIASTTQVCCFFAVAEQLIDWTSAARLQLHVARVRG